MTGAVFEGVAVCLKKRSFSETGEAVHARGNPDARENNANLQLLLEAAVQRRL